MAGSENVKVETGGAAANNEPASEKPSSNVATDKPPSFEDVYQAIMLQKVSLPVAPGMLLARTQVSALGASSAHQTHL